MNMREFIDEVVRVIEEEAENYSDPVTKFLLALLVEYDFEAAEEQLKLCADVIDNDFFLSQYKDEFLSSARALYFKCFCRVHQRIDVL